MTASDHTLKQCSRKDQCLHPDGAWLPATADYFMLHKGKLYSQCHYCRKEAKRQSHTRNREHNNERSQRWAKTHTDYRKAYYEERCTDPQFVEANRKRAREWAEANPERVKKRSKEWYWANREYSRAQAKRWVVLHPERTRETLRKYRKENRERHNELNREWERRNPEKARQKAHRRRARERNAPGSFTADDVQLQLKTQTDKRGRLRCWWCGKHIPDGYHIDHRLALDKGGSNAPENIVISCAVCNLSKGAKLLQEWNGRLF